MKNLTFALFLIWKDISKCNLVWLITLTEVITVHITFKTHTHTSRILFPMPSSCGQQQVGRACGSHLETVCLRTAFCLCGIWVTAKKRFPIFRPLKTNLWHCVCLNECVCACPCLCHQSVKRQPSSKRESALCAEVRTLESALRVQRTSLWDDRWVVCVCLCMSGRQGKKTAYTFICLFVRTGSSFRPWERSHFSKGRVFG